jgi:hypothetical protein
MATFQASFHSQGFEHNQRLKIEHEDEFEYPGKPGLFWVQHEHFNRSRVFVACALSRLAALWQEGSKHGGGLGSYGRVRSWCEADPSSSMAPMYGGWVLGGSSSGFVSSFQKELGEVGGSTPLGSVTLTRTSGRANH